jgi:hypothetical protein
MALMELSEHELKELYRYFLTCGYISYEFHIEIHKIIKRMEKELGVASKFKPLKEDDKCKLGSTP